ncbi:hypothetical protein [Tepidibacillus marianensis]|uniref:hypothetical protein n=1 Tax=Tepidibacillus marianensis TaxID=3131995 RepID=UPI0030D3C221
MYKDDSQVRFYKVDSESELIELCTRNNAILLGREAEGKRKYYLIEMQYQEFIRVVGLVNEGHGIEPHVAILRNNDSAIIASDKSVYIINLGDLKISSHLLCNSIVYDVFHDLANGNRIIIICELEVRCISSKGELLWKHDSDVITDYKLHSDFIELSTDDDKVNISLLSGQVL